MGPAVSIPRMWDGEGPEGVDFFFGKHIYRSRPLNETRLRGWSYCEPEWTASSVKTTGTSINGLEDQGSTLDNRTQFWSAIFKLLKT
jgi:hypothetical protein